MIFGKYQLLDLLGRGGMAEVFKAKSYGVEGFEKLLVIKRILPELAGNKRFVDMFIDEAKIAVTLNHANIVQVFDLGRVADSYFIAMEYVNGMDLASAIKACNRMGHEFPIDIAVYIASEVAKGLDYAHRRRDQNLQPLNIIHRDISPHNILLSYEGEVKIADFGIAKAKTTLNKEGFGVVKGKDAYMAPEQARGKTHDRRVDIFSLGVVLYETISGENPLRSESVSDTIARVKAKDYPALHRQRESDHAAKEISDIVAKAMEPNPNDRFFDAGELYESLIAFLYNRGSRTGAHSVAGFLDRLRAKEKIAAAAMQGEAQLVAAFGGGTYTASEIDTGDRTDDITSVQVPVGVVIEEGVTGARALAAEMRDVTVLALEFKGASASKDLSGRLLAVIQQNGGTIMEERDDLMVAIFGMTVADGRDTLDAIDTGLKLQRLAMMLDAEEQENPQFGVGVHPEKIVTTAGGVAREDDTYFSAISAARALARRGVGWVITSEAGKELASDSFRFEDVTTTGPGGFGRTACKVVGRRPVAEIYGRLFGRREELRTIGEILAMVSRFQGRLLAVVGEAGAGKTRVMHEVQQRLAKGGHDIGWYEAACVPWRNATPFAAIATMFRSILAIGEVESESALKAKVGRLRELGLIPEEVEAVSVMLGLSSEQGVGPEERAKQLRSAVIRSVSRLAQDKMTILFWDNLNYVDKESLDILYHLGRSIDHLPFLLAMAFRPGLSHEWDKLKNYGEIGLNPLSEAESKHLALSRLKSRRAPEDLLVDIALKSGGNPLYIEEYIKALFANGVVKIQSGELVYDPKSDLLELPKTLRGLVGARVKRLPIEHQGLLQRAAVMGQRFNIEILSHVTGISLEDIRPILLGLKDAGLLTRISAGEFTFATDLVRDVVYDGIVLSDRKEIHAALARAIEELFQDRLDEFVERLAVHYREGGDRQKAASYLVRAGRKLASDYSHSAALDYYLKAMELLQNVPNPDMNQIFDLYLPIGRLAVKANMFELGLEKMRLAEELAESFEDKRRLIQILRITADLQARSGRYVEAQQYFEQAIELADDLGDKELRCEVRATTGEIFNEIGDMKKAAKYYREAIDLWPESGDRNLLITLMAQLSKAEGNAGETDRALRTISKAEKLISHATDPITRSVFERCRAMVYYMRREPDTFIHYSMKALEIAKEYDLKDQITANAHNIGDSYVSLGEYSKAFFYLKMSQEIAIEIKFEKFMNLNTIFLSFIDALKFGSNEGLSQLEKALAVANAQNSVWEQIQAHYFLGRIRFERKQYDLAKFHLEQSIRIGRAADNRIYDAQSFDLLEQIKEIERGVRA